MFAIKTEVLRKLLADKQCVSELNRAGNRGEVEWVLAKHARKHGFKVETVK